MSKEIPWQSHLEVHQWMVVSEKDKKAIKELEFQEKYIQPEYFESEEFLKIVEMAGMEIVENRNAVGGENPYMLCYKGEPVGVKIQSLKFSPFSECDTDKEFQLESSENMEEEEFDLIECDEEEASDCETII